MANPSEAAIRHLCDHLDIDPTFFVECLHESIVEVQEAEGHLDLLNGTALHLRRLQRICDTFHVELPVAQLLYELRRQVSELEVEVRFLKRNHP